jgi:hypothetical protein
MRTLLRNPQLTASGIIFFLVLVLGAAPSYAQWLPVVQLTDVPGMSATSYSGGVNGSQIATDDSDVHIVWFYDRGVGSEIYYMRSTDEGATWGEKVPLTNDAGKAVVPVVAACESVVHVLWTDDRDATSRVYYRRSTNRGVTWGEEMLLSSDSMTTINPAIVCSGDDAYVMWQNRSMTGLTIGFLRSTDQGATWMPEETLWRMEELESFHYYPHPSIAVSEGVLTCVWLNYEGENRDLYACWSTNGGQSWIEPVRITDSPSGELLPCLAVNGNDAHVFWWSRDEDSRIKVFYSRSHDGGLTWTPASVFSDVGTNSSWRARAVCGGANVHVVWADTRIGKDIFYRCSTDAGETWSEDMRISEGVYGDASEASVAVHDSKLHVVWMEDQGSDAQIFYRNNPNGNVMGISQERDAVLDDLHLLQNYPNPCRNRTIIAYKLEHRENVRVQVFDLLGRIVAEFNQGMRNPGTHTIDFSTLGWKPGNYYYALVAGSEARGRFMTVWK